MIGKAAGARTFNFPVVCDVTPDAINDALRSIQNQMNDSIAPILKNFDGDDGKDKKIKCGTMAARTVVIDNPYDWTSNVSSELESGRAWNAIGVSPEKTHLYGVRNLPSSSNGALEVHQIDPDTELPASATPQGSVSSTDLDSSQSGFMAIAPSGRYVAVVVSTNILQLVDVTSPANPTLVGRLTLSTTVAANSVPVWLSRKPYLFIPTGGSTTLGLVIDVSDPNDPTEVETFDSGDSDITNFNAFRVTKDEQTLYACGEDGVEAWDISNPASVVQVSSVTNLARVWDDLALNEDEGWIAVFEYVSTTQIACETIDISSSDLATISLNTTQNITGTYPTTGYGPIRMVSAGTNAVAAFSGKGSSNNGRLIVFNLDDLTSVVVEEDFDVDGLDTSLRWFRSTDTQRRGLNRLWLQQGLDSEIELFEPETKNCRIPCQLEISRIKFTGATDKCPGSKIFVGIPDNHPTIDNLDAEFLQGYEPYDFALADHGHDDLYVPVDTTDYIKADGSIAYTDAPDFGGKLPDNAIFLRGFIDGLITELDTDDEHDVKVNAGVCADSLQNNDRIIYLSAAITKQIDASWAAGDDEGGMATGSVASDTEYNLIIIDKDSDGTVDMMFDVSASGANAPSGWTARRRIGSVFTNGSANISPYVQKGNRFYYDDSNVDVNNTTGTLDTFEVGTFTVPGNSLAFLVFEPRATGATSVLARVRPEGATGTPTAIVRLDDDDADARLRIGVPFYYPVNASSQLEYTLNASGGSPAWDRMRIFTFGWIDSRGCNV